MEFNNNILQLSSFFAVTMGIIVLFVGKRINDAAGFLREFSIPEPVTVGLIFSVLIAFFYLLSDIEIHFDLAAGDVLLVYFFTTIGINASLKDLLAGGRYNRTRDALLHTIQILQERSWSGINN